MIESLLTTPFKTLEREEITCNSEEDSDLGTLKSQVSSEIVSSEKCDEIVKIALTYDKIEPQITGNIDLPDFRRGIARKIYPDNKSAKDLYNFILTIANIENYKYYNFDLNGIHSAIEYVEYLPGNGHFMWHDDYSHGLAESPRKLTLIIQLSNSIEYEGGNFESWSVPLSSLPREKGNIIILPSFVPHQVTPITKGCRRALVAWIGGPRLR